MVVKEVNRGSGSREWVIEERRKEANYILSFD